MRKYLCGKGPAVPAPISPKASGGAPRNSFKMPPDVRRVNAEIDAIFASALTQATSSPPADQYHQRQLLGTLLLFDKTLSVNKNLACTTCHDPAAGFTGGSSLFNQTVVAQPGSVAITNAGPGALITASLRANPKRTAMRPLRPSSTTTRPRVISTEATSGICAPPEPA